MGKLIFCALFASLASIAGAQDLINGEREGLIQATASIYPSRMLNHGISNNYVAGHANYYFTDLYSVRGEIMHYIDAQREERYIDKHTQFQLAVGRHFPKKRFDPYIYASLGLASVRLIEEPKSYAQPVAGIIGGSHFQFSDYFYFFLEMQYQHMQDPLHSRPLDQLYFSGGLGFQVPTRKSD
jgi:hypothetical protein